jgi:hypothetical protein
MKGLSYIDSDDEFEQLAISPIKRVDPIVTTPRLPPKSAAEISRRVRKRLALQFTNQSEFVQKLLDGPVDYLPHYNSDEDEETDFQEELRRHIDECLRIGLNDIKPTITKKPVKRLRTRMMITRSMAKPVSAGLRSKK